MPPTSHIHDAGFFSLHVPEGWLAEQPNTGTLLLHDSAGDIAISLVAISKAPPSSAKSSVPATRITAPLEAQFELQKWIESQSVVQIRQSPRLITGTPYATATTEGLQRRRRRGSWIRGLLNRLTGQNAGIVLWRYWAILNPHLLILASCNGKPAALERQRGTIDRLIASVQLPDRDILIGRHFTEMVVSLARSWFPQTAVSVIDDVHVQFGTQNLSLAGLHRRYLSSPEELPKQVRAFLIQLQGSLPAAALAGTWRHASQRIMPVFLRPEVLQAAAGIIHEEWINDLAIGYALEDSPPSAPADAAPPAGNPAAALETVQPPKLLEPVPAQRVITYEDLKRWSITAEDLHEQAMHNLVLYSHEHMMHGRHEDGYTIMSLAHSDRHNAARILLPELHHKLREHLGTTFLAAMPTRETLFAFNIKDPEIIARMRKNLSQIFELSPPPHGISPKFFLVTPDGIAGDPADGPVL
ncbi:MAG TPA: hypothetical protein VGN88_00630 [Phycisphaerae bacterium]|jgi:hypothetical protein